jgi:hypothetical protein
MTVNCGAVIARTCQERRIPISLSLSGSSAEVRLGRGLACDNGEQAQTGPLRDIAGDTMPVFLVEEQ